MKLLTLLAIPFYAIALLFLLAFRIFEGVGNKFAEPPQLFVKQHE